MLKRLFGRVPAAPAPTSAARAAGPHATPDDVYSCYRLFFNREPDPDGWQAWNNHISAFPTSVNQLVTSFLTSAEFAQSYLNSDTLRFTFADLRPQLVDLDPIKLYISARDHAVGLALVDGAAGYEPHVRRVLSDILRPGQTFLDIGANIGYFSMLAAHLVGETGRVIAIEPNPENCLLIRSSLATNGFRHVDVYPYAAGSEPAMFMLEVEGSNGRLVPLEGRPALSRLRFLVPVTPLDGLLGELPRLDLIKIDIEGAEPMAFAGMQAALKRHRPVIISEFSPAMLRATSRVEPQAYLAILRDLGYQLAVINPDGSTTPLPAEYAAVEQTYFADNRSHVDLLARQG
jgi:FkbM family methyltransferase